MELDHQQMAGASFGKPITAAVPGIRGDSSEVTAWDFTCSRAATQGSIPLDPLFGFPYLFLTPCSPAKPQHGAAYAAGSLQAARRGEERARHWSCKPWLRGNWQHLAFCSSGSASRHCSTCEKALKQVRNGCKTQRSLLRRAFDKQMKGEAIYCRARGSCNRIKLLRVLALIDR